MANLRYDLFPTDTGWVGAMASPQGLRTTTLPCPTRKSAWAALGPQAEGAIPDSEALSHAREALRAWAEGREPGEAVPLDLEGAPPFFRAAWEACRSIPRGETRSYGWLAAAAGRPDAARAAGQAMARNPLPLAVP